MNLTKLSFAILATMLLGVTFGRSQIIVTNIVATQEGAIQLTWTSVSNEVYEIDEADALNTNSDGSTAWNLLYTAYPSQGATTFWLDTGNYNLSPEIVHPKYMPMRFYRIVDLGPDTTSDEPWVSITALTNSTVTGELTITAVAGTDQPAISSVKLYVDGQEMQMADAVTNYTDSTGVTNYEAATFNINTCEWMNGSHILFATVECQSGNGDAINYGGPITTGHAVSSFVPVTFNNLVTSIAFSQPTFDPSSGQTQQVTANFTANSDWTLTIVDVNSNTVRTATGSGTSMLFNWDGNDNSGGTLPNGVYYYYVSAQTNGQSSLVVSPSGGGGGSPPSPDFALSSSSFNAGSSELWAIAPGSDNAVPLALYPPGFDTNGFTIFSASPSEMQAARPSLQSQSSFAMSSGSFAADASSSSSSPSSQNSPAAPQRPPTNPVRGLAGTFGVTYDTFTGNGTNGFTFRPLGNGLPYGGGYISMDNINADSSLYMAPLPQYTTEANNFISCMKFYGWKNTLLKYDNSLSINDLKGSGASINNVNLGIYLSHCGYGTGQNGIDYAANGCKQMYLPVTSGSGGQFLRLSEMNLGGSGPNGLKWMALLGCNTLQHNNWASMNNKGIYPYNSNLHLLLGVDTEQATNARLLWFWAKYMNYGTSPNKGAYSPLTIRNAWYQAARDAFAGTNPGYTVSFIVAGDSACSGDYLKTNATPSGSWFIDPPTQVYP